MAGNRVDPQWVEHFSDFAALYWEKMMREANVMFAQPSPDPKSRDYLKIVAAKERAEGAVLQKLKLLAQMRSGAIHGIGKNTTEEKDAAAEFLALARSALGTSPVETPKKMRTPHKSKEEKLALYKAANAAKAAAKAVDGGEG